MTPVEARTRTRLWWFPLAIIAAALLSLFAAPYFTTTRLQEIRVYVTDVLSPALVRTNDLEAALATEFAARSEIAEGAGETSAAARAADAAHASITRDEQALDSLVRRAGPEAIARFSEARASITAWQREEDRFQAESRSGHEVVHGAAASASRGRRWEAIQVAQDNMQRLEDELNARAADRHVQVDDLERLGVIVPAGLVPLALLALGAVAWTARRTILLSEAAAMGQRDAERAMAAKSALMRGVTHDLKNPLGAARGYADLLVDGALGPLPDAQAKVIHRLRNLLTATLDTVNDLVEVSRAESGQLKIERQECDVAQIARDSVDDYRAMSDVAGLTLGFDADAVALEGAARVSTDPARVRQVLGNLLSNAVKYTPQGGTVRVVVSPRHDEALGQVVAFDVADTGPGISEALHERVFEEFFRVPATVAIAQGTGVGLAIARRLARLLGGDLRVSETPGGGATFSLLLPSR
ncbi:MAG: HAMP domain-containing histidine kinase [Gemmatimonadota bacterium]|nr:HAMP domain-containing histidine kinase [Gemmatimonadota bacterium]